MISISDAFRTYLMQNGSGIYEQLEQLRRCSSKLAFMIQTILENPTQKVFIYCRFNLGGGTLMVSALLNHFGFTRMIDATSIPGKRYAVITNDTNTSAMTENQIRSYNEANNDHGEICQVIVGSHVIGEGVTLKSVRKTFILSGFWNEATIDQAIGRSIRSFSHDRLPEEERIVELYRLVAIGQAPSCPIPVDFAGQSYAQLSIDMHMYTISEAKDFRIKQIERVLKESAIDCTMNRQRNILPTDQPESKQCDYSENCNYICDYVTDKSTNQEGSITDTYNLYYADHEIAHIIEEIRGLFRFKSAYDFEELFSKLTGPMNSIVLARALHIMIAFNQPVSNRYGFTNYIRTDRNMYFLVDDPMSGNLYWNSKYADRPVPKTNEDNFNKVFLYFTNLQLERIKEQLRDNLSSPETMKQILLNLPPILFTHLVELYTREMLAANEALAYYRDDATKMETIRQSIDPVASGVYTLFKDNMKPYTFDGITYMVNEINTLIPRYARLDDLLNVELEYVEWMEGGVILEELKAQRELVLRSLQENPLRYFAVGDPKSEEVFRIKAVQEPRYKADGSVDKRGRQDAGTDCNSFSLEKLMDMYVNIVYVMSHLSSPLPNVANPPFVTEVVPFAHTVKDVLSMIDTLRKSPSFKKYVLPALVNRYKYNEYVQTLEFDEKGQKRSKEQLIQVAMDKDTILSYHKSQEDKVKGSYGYLEYNTDVLTFLATNDYVQKYLQHLLFGHVSDDQMNMYGTDCLASILGLPVQFLYERHTEEEEKEMSSWMLSEGPSWNGVYLQSVLSLVHVLDGDKVQTKKLLCDEMRRFLYLAGYTLKTSKTDMGAGKEEGMAEKEQKPAKRGGRKKKET